MALPLLAVPLSLATVVAAQPGYIGTVAGTGTDGFNGDDIPATTSTDWKPPKALSTRP